MATGGIPLARVLTLLALIAFPAAFTTFDSTATAQDSEAGQLLKEGLLLQRQGNSKEAIAKLRQALAAEPSSEEVLAALGRVEYSALMGLMASGQDGANIAKAILDRAMPILPDRAFDEQEMRRLITEAVTAQDYRDRFEAAMSLARTYGEFAVPGLVAYLASSNTDHRVNAHITLMSRIGRDAVLPLNEVLQSDNDTVRRMVASALGVIGDERSLAALTERAETDPSTDARAKAVEAAAKLHAKFPWAQGMNASQLYLKLAQLYYAGNYRVMAFSDKPLVVWRFDSGLKRTSTPRHLYVLKLAEEAAYDALRLDAENVEAAALLGRILASERLASDAMADRADDELTQQFAAQLADAPATIAALGWDVLERALSDALDQQDHGAAMMLLRVMPWAYGGGDFGTDHPVVRATSASAVSVRLAAAAAILRFNGTERITSFPDPDGFIGLVARSVGEIIPRNILVVDANDQRRNKMLAELNQAGYIAYDARTGSDGFVRATRYAGLDLIVLTSNQGDMDPVDVIGRLRADNRTKNVPVVVVGSAAEASDDVWRNLFKDRAAGMASVAEGPGDPSEEFLAAVKGSFAADAPAAAERYARSADILDALAGTDTGNALFNWNALTETVSGLLTADVPSDPPVKKNALHALANLGDPSCLEGLADFFASHDDAAHKAAAGHAIAAICRGNGVSLASNQFASLVKGTGHGSADVRRAAFAALAAADLTPSQIAEVMMANRPGASGGGGDDSGGGDDDDNGCGCGEDDG